jgi:hypothetical protein
MNPQDEVDVYGFGHIVHPTDLTTAGEAAFAHALRLALAAKGHLRIVHVEKPGIV